MPDPIDIISDLPRIAEEPIGPADLDSRLKDARHPFVVRSIASDWPLVRAGMKSGSEARRYLLDRKRDRAFFVHVGESGGDDRLFYDSAMAMNFRVSQGSLESIFGQIESAERRGDSTPIYLSSVDMDAFFSGLNEENRIPLGDRKPLESIWIGTRTRIAAHNDVPDNFAICAVGRRRFTLFPPEQFANLYLGPIENNPAGRPVSMVDLRAPDFDKHPRFREALAHAQVAELEPGDAIFVPSLWWHHVEATEPFNVLVNYWWRDVPAFLGNPEDALNLAILAIRDLPEPDRARWSALFDHYVFSGGAEAASHLPPEARGILAPLTVGTAGKIRAKLLRSLSG